MLFIVEMVGDVKVLFVKVWTEVNVTTVSVITGSVNVVPAVGFIIAVWIELNCTLSVVFNDWSYEVISDVNAIVPLVVKG